MAWPIILAAGALLSLVLLVRTPAGVADYLAGREAHAVHVLMNGAMAATAWPRLPVAAWPWLLALLVAGDVALVASALVAWRRGGHERLAGTLYHLFGLAVMTWATNTMAGMAGKMGMGAPPLAMRLGAVLFGIDGVATLLLVLVRPAALAAMRQRVAPHAPAVGAAELRWSAIPHLVMDAGMVAMLL